MISAVLLLAAQQQTPPPIVTPPAAPRPVIQQRALQRPALSIPDNEQTMAYKTVGNWMVRIDLTLGGGCYLYSGFYDLSSLRIAISPSLQEIQFHIGNPKWHSLTPDMTYSTKISLDSKSPWSGQASVTRFDTTNFLSLAITDSKFFDEFSGATDMKVYYGDKLVSHTDITDSEKAVEALVECQNKVSDIVDPFAQ